MYLMFVAILFAIRIQKLFHGKRKGNTEETLFSCMYTNRRFFTLLTTNKSINASEIKSVATSPVVLR